MYKLGFQQFLISKVRTTFSRTSGMDTNQFSIFDVLMFFAVLLLSFAQLLQVVCALYGHHMLES